ARARARPQKPNLSAQYIFTLCAAQVASDKINRPPSETGATADQLRLRPQDLLELGFARSIVS
ncbi:acetyl-CoA carboxylase, partial [Streptomyces anulatus]